VTQQTLSRDEVATFAAAMSASLGRAVDDLAEDCAGLAEVRDDPTLIDIGIGCAEGVGTMWELYSEQSALNADPAEPAEVPR
jgi:hypothetical protein